MLKEIIRNNNLEVKIYIINRNIFTTNSLKAKRIELECFYFMDQPEWIETDKSIITGNHIILRNTSFPKLRHGTGMTLFKYKWITPRRLLQRH